jgi:archaellum component FlaF (FlaF/FlaG flagellin family)
MGYSDSEYQIYWWWNKYTVIFTIIIFLVGVAAVLYYDVPGKIEAHHTAKENYRTEISNQTLLYNGTLSTITYQYGYWGSVDSTKLTFKDGTQFTFSSQLIAQIGTNYTVTVRETLFKDNHKENKILSILENPTV